MKKLFEKFFSQFFVYGILVILCANIINLYFIDCFWKNISVNTLSTIGIALFIGSIFDFSKNSKEFMDFISSILKDIIISKNFLKGLEDKEKKKALEMVLTPSGDQLAQYSDIEMYFKKKIDDSMEIFHTNFKTNLSVNAEARKKDNIVQVFVVLTYRVYKIEEKYFPLVTTFERNDCFVERSYIISPNGVKEIKEEDMTNIENEVSPINVKKFTYDIPTELYNYPYLTIKKEVIEKGYDHWANFHWNTLTPSDGINFNLTCFDNLHIKEFFICDDEKNYNVTENEDKTKINIISTTWLDKNSGFLFTISDT